MDRNQLGFDEGDAKRILQRAAALDARIVGRLSVDELKSVAREAGISETAVSMALAEALEGSAVTAEPPHRRFKFLDRFRLHVLATLSAALGFFAGAVTDSFATGGPGSMQVVGGAAALLLVLAIAGAARAIKRDRFNEYRVLNGLLWIGFGFGYTYMHGLPGHAPTIAGAGWAVSTGVGALILAVKMYLGSSTAPGRTDEVNATARA
jgi:hypothetical protein